MARDLNETWNITTGPFSQICGGPVQYRHSKVGFAARTHFHLYNEYSEAGRLLPFLPYEIYNHEIFQFPEYSVKYKGLASMVTCIGGLSWTSMGSLAQCDYEASNWFYKDVGNLKRSNIAVSALESRESIKLVGDSAARIANAFLQLKRGNINGAMKAIGVGSSTADFKKVPKHIKKARRLKNMKSYHKSMRRDYDVAKKARRVNPRSVADFASQSWLELQFGWAPIYQDIFDIAEAAGEVLVNEKLNLLRFSGSSEVEINENEFVVGSAQFGQIDSFNGFHVVRYESRGTVQNVNLINNTTLGFTNPASIAWELLPFSFVVDWFLPVGNYLESLTGLQGIQITSNMRSELTNYGVSGSSNHPDAPGSMALIHQEFKRTLPVSAPEHHLPKVDLGNVLSIWTAITSIALLKQVFFAKTD